MGPQGIQGPPGPAGATPWTVTGSDVYYTAGRVGIGTASPGDALHIETSGNNGVLVFNSNLTGTAVNAWAISPTGLNFGVRGRTNSPQGAGVYGFGPFTGVQGEVTQPGGTGVFGANTATSGNAFGVQGLSGSVAGVGVYGGANLSGVWGETNSPTGRGVYANNTAISGPANAIVATSAGPFATTILATGSFVGVHGRTSGTIARAVYGEATGGNGQSFGVYATVMSDQGTGVYARAFNISTNGNARYGVWAEAPVLTNSWAGWFQGNVNITGSIFAASKSFRIDHPLDPQNTYLNHVSVESPDMKTMYDGLVTLDERGEAWVTLPRYFEALNRDFRYQLTCVGGHAPVYIAERVRENRFLIAGGVPGLEVSWTVTGIRKDPWAERNRVVVEEPKGPGQRGTYLAPEAYGKPAILREGLPAAVPSPRITGPEPR